jgi:hypothetical protein
VSTTVEALEEAFAAAVRRIPEVREAYDHEPDLTQGMALPAVTMLWTDLVQDDVDTGPYTQNQWGWDVTVYVPLEVGWRDAQRLLKQIVAAILSLVREDPRLNEEADLIRISDGGPPIFDHGEHAGYLQKTLRLTARTTER